MTEKLTFAPRTRLESGGAFALTVPREEVASSGYVAESLEAALWCVGRTTSFADAVVLADNLGDDADTVAAITGQIAGGLYSVGGISKDWPAKLAWPERIEAMVEKAVLSG